MTNSPLPLAGWRVLVPRGGQWGEDAAAQLRAHGASALIADLIRFVPPANLARRDQALKDLAEGAFDWLTVTSATTVEMLREQDALVPITTKIAAVGEATAAALNEVGYTVDFLPGEDHSARGLVESWRKELPAARVLCLHSELASPELVDGLTRLGCTVSSVSAYRTLGNTVPATVAEAVSQRSVNAILVTSGSVARQIHAQFPVLPESTIVVAIGPRTREDATAAGLRIDVVAQARSVSSLIDALVRVASVRLAGE